MSQVELWLPPQYSQLNEARQRCLLSNGRIVLIVMNFSPRLCRSGSHRKTATLCDIPVCCQVINRLGIWCRIGLY